MEEYHKIQSIFKRDEDTHKFIEDEYSCPEFKYLKDSQWYWTEKVDGTNIRVIYNPTMSDWQESPLSFAGKTDRAQMPKHLETRLKDIFMPQLHIFEENFPEGVCLYGEGYGHKIQKGGKYIPNNECDFILFDIKIGNWWLKREDIEGIAKMFGIDTVPVLSVDSLSNTIIGFPLQTAIDFVRKGFLSTVAINHGIMDTQAEGLVLKPIVELKARNGERIITKIKTKDF